MDDNNVKLDNEKLEKKLSPRDAYALSQYFFNTEEYYSFQIKFNDSWKSSFDSIINPSSELDIPVLKRNIGHKRFINLDGPSCMGKSTLILDSRRHKTKLNQSWPEITKGSDYNSIVGLCILYMMLSRERILLDPNMYYLRDRSQFSNYLYQLIHPFVSEMKEFIKIYNREMSRDEIEARVSYYFSRTNFTKIYAENVRDDECFIIIVDSNFEAVSKRMLKRGSVGDFSYAQDYEYIKAQYYFYKAFTNLTPKDSCLLIDINEHFSGNLKEMQKCLLSIIDAFPNAQNAVPNSESVVYPRNIETEEYIKFLKSTNHLDFMYRFSKK